jgi:aspartate/methionine/tyrosine aminotransferase
MTRVRAPYLEWSRSRPPAAVDLAASNLVSCPLSEIPGAREAMDLAPETPTGYPPLLDAIAARAGVDPGRVAAAGGCTGANFLVCAALVSPGDEAIVEWPGYDPLVAAAQLSGASVRSFERRFDDGWAVDPDRLEAAVTPRTKLVILSSPHNPSGVLASDPALEEIARIAERRGFHVLVDEVYAGTLERPQPPAAATRSPAFLSTSSLTKAYGLAALRCGWVISDGETADEIRRVRGLVDGSGPIPSERLAEAAISNLDRLADRARAILEPNRRLWRAFLADRPELECVPSPSSIAFPRFADGRDAAPFAERLQAEEGVAVAPGTFFGAPSHFRVSLGGTTDALAHGLDAITRSLASVRAG